MLQDILVRIKNKITYETRLLLYGRNKLKRFKIKSRYVEDFFKYKKTVFKFPDGASFAFMFEEIFLNEIYKFDTKQSNPYIIDCGANIGLSAVYFSELYPNSEIVSFEPDKKIFSFLRENTKHLKNVRLHQLGLWKENTTLVFKNEGADAGRISFEYDKTTFKTSQEIDVVKLSDYINKPVAFLKIDIEGAEWEVIEEIKTKLHYVENLFIEYHSFTQNKQKLDSILNILSNCGFRYYIDSPSRIRTKPFIDTSTMLSMDMLVNIFAQKH